MVAERWRRPARIVCGIAFSAFGVAAMPAACLYPEFTFDQPGGDGSGGASASGGGGGSMTSSGSGGMRGVFLQSGDGAGVPSAAGDHGPKCDVRQHGELHREGHDARGLGRNLLWDVRISRRRHAMQRAVQCGGDFAGSHGDGRVVRDAGRAGDGAAPLVGDSR